MSATENPTALVVIFLLIALAIGLFCRNILARVVPIPYTVVLLVLGVVIGIGNHYTNSFQLHDAVESWASVDPHVILIVFLPALVFESAFSVDFHTFRHAFWQIFTLAVPGLVIGTALLGLVAKYIFPYEWSWSASLLLGAILCATDPVAVVALLKELGAPEELAMLIEGESLLNDGTAMVAFHLFLDMLVGDAGSVGDMVGTAFQLAFVGPIIGAVLAAVAVFCIGYVYNDAMTEVTITLVACYSAFILAEATVLHTSGILAVVTVGILMSAYGKVRISPEVEGYLHNFWELIGYISNTVIFVVSGLIIAEKTLFTSLIELREWLLLLLLYVIMHVVRYVTMLICLPCLRLGYSVSWRDIVLMGFAGLRGAVGLSLALIVEQTDSLPETLRKRVLFYVAGVCFLTLFINGSLTKFVLRKLGIGGETEESRRLFDHACELLNVYTETQMDEMTSWEFFTEADWPQVWAYLPVFTKGVYEKRLASREAPQAVQDVPPRLQNRWQRYQRQFGTEAGSSSRKDAELHREGRRSLGEVEAPLLEHDILHESLTQGHTQQEKLLVVSRQRFVQALRAEFWHQYEHGLVEHSALRLLLDAESWQFDRCETHPLGEWTGLLARSVELPDWFNCLQAVPGLRHLAAPLTFQHFQLGYESAAAFIEVHRAVAKKSRMWGMDDTIANALVEESEAQVAEAQEFVKHLQSGFPEICRAVQTKHVVEAVLHAERTYIQELLRDGAIDQAQYDRLIRGNNASLKKVSQHPPTSALPTIADRLRHSRLLQECVGVCILGIESFDLMAIIPIGALVFFCIGWTGSIEENVLASVRDQIQSSVLQPGVRLFSQGDMARGIYVIFSGSLTLSATIDAGEVATGFDTSDRRIQDFIDSDQAQDAAVVTRIGPGDTVGQLAVLLGTLHVTSIQADTHVQAAFLPANLVHELVQQSPEFATNLWRETATLVAHLFLDTFAPFSVMDIRQVMLSATVVFPWTHAVALGATEPLRQSRRRLFTGRRGGVTPQSSAAGDAEYESLRAEDDGQTSSVPETAQLLHGDAAGYWKPQSIGVPPRSFRLPGAAEWTRQSARLGYGSHGWFLLEEGVAVLLRGKLVQRGLEPCSVQAFHTIHSCPDPLRFTKDAVLVVLPEDSWAQLQRGVMDHAATELRHPRIPRVTSMHSLTARGLADAPVSTRQSSVILDRRGSVQGAMRQGAPGAASGHGRFGVQFNQLENAARRRHRASMDVADPQTLELSSVTSSHRGRGIRREP